MAWLIALKRWWYTAVIALLVLVCAYQKDRAVYWHQKADICASQREQDKKTYEAAAAQAAENNKATVLATERKWQTVVENTSKEYNAKLKDANALVASYIDGVQYNQARAAGANQGSSGSTGVSPASFSASGSIGTSKAALIPVPSDDLYVCSENTIKASEWQSWYGQLQKAQDDVIGKMDVP